MIPAGSMPMEGRTAICATYDGPERSDIEARLKRVEVEGNLACVTGFGHWNVNNKRQGVAFVDVWRRVIVFFLTFPSVFGSQAERVWKPVLHLSFSPNRQLVKSEYASTKARARCASSSNPSLGLNSAEPRPKLLTPAA